MDTALVLTVIGADRTGLVEVVAAAVAEHGGNWVESRMARLAGRFAGVLRVDVPAERAGALGEALRALGGQGLQVVVEQAEGAGDVSAAGEAMTLEVLGHDRPGIVRDVARALAQRRVNVVELETTVYSAPMTGEPLFEAHVSLRLPAGADVDELRESLEAIASELMVDVRLGAGVDGQV